MNVLDWAVVIVYLTLIVYFANVYGRSQGNIRQYFLAGNRIRWWQSGFSAMATQLGAISFVSAPAFVALAKDGGLKWLCYEFGVPLGILFVVIVIVPVLHRGRHISIYEYLEERFDRQTRILVSFLFQLGRALATAVSVFAGGLILSTALTIPTHAAILVIGSITILYDVLGGMRIVILSDVLQMGIIVIGFLVCGGVALYLVGWTEGWAALPPDRFRILDFRHFGLSETGAYAFWPMTLGGIFLYASYYGCDQSQMQRQLSVANLKDAKKSLLLNAFGRFPLVFFYCIMGVFVGALVLSPEGLQTIGATLGMQPSAVSNTLARDPDRMLPMFILSYLPHGIIGLIFVAIMSALMSSLDSAINSLSAVTMRDFYQPFLRPSEKESHYLKASKLITASWGLFCIAAALAFATANESARHTTIVLINAVGSLLYGPILAAFALGIISKSLRARSIKVGILAGVVGNVGIWLMSDLSWLWWNVTGFLLVVVFAFTNAILDRTPIRFRNDRIAKLTIDRSELLNWGSDRAAVLFYVFFIIAVCWTVQNGLITGIRG
ncbi:MAG: sodium/solute symporter [Deltaproteobacteria bacterium]|nr:sodium/solute symporter [Deltaproteobacteria bacterium]